MNSISALFASRSKKLQFEAGISIESLTDIPLVFGRFYIRWKLRNALNEQHGHTQSISIVDHTVVWNHCFNVKVVLVIGKDGTLLPCDLLLNIKKETHGGKKSESIGRVTIDLSQFVHASKNRNTTPNTMNEDGTSRQYLLQQSKMNSTLKVSIDMKPSGNIDESTTESSSSSKRWSQNQNFKSILKGPQSSSSSSSTTATTTTTTTTTNTVNISTLNNIAGTNNNNNNNNNDDIKLLQNFAEYPFNTSLEFDEGDIGQAQRLIDEIFQTLEDKERLKINQIN